jgi:hypothetical protein
MMMKSGIPNERISDFLGQEMKVDLKNHHTVIGTMVFYHLTEQMIHLMEWVEYDDNGAEFRRGKYMVVNRTAWFQLFQ